MKISKLIIELLYLKLQSFFIIDSNFILKLLILKY